MKGGFTMTGINVRIDEALKKKLKASCYKTAPLVNKLLTEFFNKQEEQEHTKK